MEKGSPLVEGCSAVRSLYVAFPFLPPLLLSYPNYLSSTSIFKSSVDYRKIPPLSSFRPYLLLFCCLVSIPNADSELSSQSFRAGPVERLREEQRSHHQWRRSKKITSVINEEKLWSRSSALAAVGKSTRI